MQFLIFKFVKEKICFHKKRVVLSLGLIFLFLLSVLISYFYFRSVKIVADEPESEAKLAETENESQENNSASFNILLLGYGGEGHSGGALSDSIIVANVAPEKRQITLISVPRDLWVKIPTRSDKKQNYKINAAYAIGGDDVTYPLKELQYKGRNGAGEMAKSVVNEVVGLPIEYYVAINFGGVIELVDALGGIEVNVPVAFDDYFYPVKGLENETCGFSREEIDEFHADYSGFQLEKQFECRYEHLHFDVGKQVMSGEEVLKFVRSRHSDQHGGDFARSERQMAVLLGVKDKILSLRFLENIPALFDKFSSMVKTDLDVEIVGRIVKTYPNLPDFSILAINLSTDNVLYFSVSSNGQFILVPKDGVGNWEGVHEFIQRNLNLNQ